jgi:alpha-glucosidase
VTYTNATAVAERSARSGPWWREAVVYQVYIRSFADGSGDGIGDIAGLRSRLGYLSDLGVDGIWINPWYRSPMADGGYDVTDYFDIDPVFGTLDGADEFISACHEHGIRVIVDLVPNHTSNQHPWFKEALAAPPGSPARARYWFRPGRGDGGEEPPNDWRSRFEFVGSAWTRVHETDGTPGEWYLHLFTPEQPDLNWGNREVTEEFRSILRFWLGLGVDGFRVDAAPGLAKDPDTSHLGYWDRDEVHEIYRKWRRLIDSHPGEQQFVAEACQIGPDRVANYVRPDELHTAFSIDFLWCEWDAGRLRAVIDNTLSTLGAVGAPATWVLSNHGAVRHVSRYGRTSTGGVDLLLGTRRARAAALLLLALPGCAYIYQGDELGLWQVRSETGDPRDGCRVPLPWSGEQPPFGFSPPDASAACWLGQPSAWSEITAERQTGDQVSMLELYRRALKIRRAHPALGDGSLAWDDGAPPGVLSFTREPGFRCMVNLSAENVQLPLHDWLLPSSALESDLLLPPDSAVWLADGESPTS